MKRIVLFFFTMLLLCSCANKNIKDEVDVNENKILHSPWKLNNDFNELNIDNDDIIEYLKSSDLNNYDDYIPIALLSSQVVAGVNYMFLCKNAFGYEIVILYCDLDNNLSIYKIMPFDIENYLNNNEPNNYVSLMGGWYPYYDENNVLEIDDIEIFNPKFIEDNFDVLYKPIALLASQLASGTNYCYLAYEINSLSNISEQLVIISIHKDLNNNHSINSINYLDFKEIANISDPIPVTCH